MTLWNGYGREKARNGDHCLKRSVIYDCNPATNLDVLKKAFGHAIQSIRDTDSTGMHSSIYAQRATIIFSDNSKLYVTEKLNVVTALEDLFRKRWINRLLISNDMEFFRSRGKMFAAMIYIPDALMTFLK